MKVSLNDIINSAAFQGVAPNDIELRVNMEPVWDYKEQNHELRLIHEGTMPITEHVTLGEIVKMYGDSILDCNIVSETVDKEVQDVELLTYPTGRKAVNFKI